MRIEPEAREIIMAVLEDKGADSIVVNIINDNGNDTIALGIGLAAEADFVTTVDGVSVIVSPENLEALENVVFLVTEEGKLGVVELRSCGCGCGCGGHEDGEGCGCEGHDHEGGCGCGGHDHEHEHAHHEGGCGCGHNH